jgi:hypothetical protein
MLAPPDGGGGGLGGGGGGGGLGGGGGGGLGGGGGGGLGGGGGGGLGTASPPTGTSFQSIGQCVPVCTTTRLEWSFLFAPCAFQEHRPIPAGVLAWG